MKFMGIALAGGNFEDWFNYFLNSSNHKSGIPLDYASFHFYAHSSSRTNATTYESFFGEVDNFVRGKAQAIMDIRDKLSPDTWAVFSFRYENSKVLGAT